MPGGCLAGWNKVSTRVHADSDAPAAWHALAVFLALGGSSVPGKPCLMGEGPWDLRCWSTAVRFIQTRQLAQALALRRPAIGAIGVGDPTAATPIDCSSGRENQCRFEYRGATAPAASLQ